MVNMRKSKFHFDFTVQNTRQLEAKPQSPTVDKFLELRLGFEGERDR